ncbi:MAG: glycosyltransferase family 4 protein [Planctomycetota bacterium]|jgi:glycosyltransferase involved in cell wall biosynthesis
MQQESKTSLNSRRIEICFIAPKAYPLFNPDVKEIFGGAEVDLYSVATELAKDDNFAVSFITADYGQDKIETIEGVRVIKSVDFKKNPLIGAIRVWRAMRAADARIYFHEAASWGTFLIALFCKLHKRAFIYRTASQRECDGTYSNQHLLAGRAFRWALRNAAQVIVQNQIDKETLERTTGVPSTVIPNAHHLPVLSEGKRDIILWVGRTSPFKRAELFIDLAEEFPNERFVMICQRATGDDKYHELVARAKQVGNLEFITRVGFSEIDSYFQRATALVNTSATEGFPNTFIQACKCATPILSLRVNPDNFLNRFKCGLCADDNWDKFLKQLETLMQPGILKESGKNARKYAEVKHDIKNIASIYKELFATLEYNETWQCRS